MYIESLPKPSSRGNYHAEHCCKAAQSAGRAKKEFLYVYSMRLGPLRRKHQCLASLKVGKGFICCGAERKQQLLQEALMDAEDRQKAEAAAKRAAKRERLSKQKAEALRVQEEKAAAEAAAAAAAGQAADRADAPEAEEVSLCACAAAGARTDDRKIFCDIPVRSRTVAILRAYDKLRVGWTSATRMPSVTHTQSVHAEISLPGCRFKGTQLSAQRALRRQGQMVQPIESA